VPDCAAVTSLSPVGLVLLALLQPLKIDKPNKRVGASEEIFVIVVSFGDLRCEVFCYYAQLQ